MRDSVFTPTKPTSLVPVTFWWEMLTACGRIDDSAQAIACKSWVEVPVSAAARSQQAPEAIAPDADEIRSVAKRMRMAVYLDVRRVAVCPRWRGTSESGSRLKGGGVGFAAQALCGLRDGACTLGGVLPRMRENQVFGILFHQRQVDAGGGEVIEIELWVRVAIAR